MRAAGSFHLAGRDWGKDMAGSANQFFVALRARAFGHEKMVSEKW